MKKSVIAICGAPESGKSTVQRIIEQVYGAISIDDGESLREAAKVLYGLSDWHVSTQAGKRSMIEVAPGKYEVVRKLLGELGEHLERHDVNFIAHQALSRARASYPGKLISFGSVRREQGSVYRAAGDAVVLEIRRPDFVSHNDFDCYNPDHVDFTILNDFDESDVDGSLRRLEARVLEVLDPYFPRIRQGVAPASIAAE